MALRGGGPESEAENLRFHGRRVTKVGPEVKLSPEGWGSLNMRRERAALGPCRTFQVGGERHDRFGVVVGEGVVESRIEGRFTQRVGAGMHAHPLLPEPEMAQDALDDILIVDVRNDVHFP